MWGALDSFVEGKEESMLEIAIPPMIKATDPFLRIRKKMDLMVDFEKAKRAWLVGSDEREGLAPRRRPHIEPGC